MHCDIDSDNPLTIQCQPIDTPQTVDRIDSDCGNPADTVLRCLGEDLKGAYLVNMKFAELCVH